MINLLAASKALQVFIPALILLVLAMLFAIALAYLGKKLAVSRDERIDQVRDCLSGANCGACGYAGCDGFATALVEGKAELSSCNATSKEKKEEIAEILGLTDTGEATKVVVCCHGGQDAKDKYDYVGYGDCRSMELLAGGRKQCAWGCLGNGLMRGRVPASRRYRKTKRIFRSVIKQVHFLRQVHFGVSEKDNKKDPRKRDLLRCVQQSPER